MKDSSRLAVIGAAASPVGWFPDKLGLDAAIEVIRKAISDAGIAKSEVGGIFISPPLGDEWLEYHLSFARLIDELGLGKTNKFTGQIQASGAGFKTMLGAVRGAIVTEEPKNILLLHTQTISGLPKRLPPEAIEGLYWDSSRQYPEWEFHCGMSSDARAALVTQRYMHETGTTAEQLASVVVSHHKWAQLNPNARFGSPVTIQDVMNSEIVADPIHDLECTKLSDAASALILTSVERAKSMGKKPVYVLGEGSGRCTHFSIAQKPDKDVTNMAGLSEAVETALKQAGVKLGDIDIVEAHGGYPVYTLMELEGAGFCKRGEAGAFVMGGNTSPGGKLPMSTNGDSLAEGHTGYGTSFRTVYEAVLQLRGQAGKRQVEGAKLIMCIFAETKAFMEFDVAILGK